jgi:type I restriction enzyme M protein
VKVTNNNKLTQNNIKTILAAFTARSSSDHFAKLVPNGEVEAQDYNLSVSTYVDQKDTREATDIVALNARIEEIVAREDILRQQIKKLIKDIERSE